MKHLPRPIWYNDSVKMLKLLYKCVFGLLALIAVGAQLMSTIQNHFSISNFFSYFTIESNIFAAIVVLMSALFLARGQKVQLFNYFRGAAALYMIVTGIVYTLLLSKGNDGSVATWINVVLHYVFPVVMLFDWLIDRPRPALVFKKALWWLAFPLAFLAYSLVRGPHVQWYPYPFLDPRQQGYGRVFLTCVVIFVAGIMLTFLLSAYTRLGTRQYRS